MYYIYDYGDNYFRNIGIMNTGRLGSPAVLAAARSHADDQRSGQCSAFHGNGRNLVPGRRLCAAVSVLGGTHGRLQPFGAFTHKNLAWLDDPAFNWDMGLIT